jgi:hypothetical protein
MLDKFKEILYLSKSEDRRFSQNKKFMGSEAILIEFF